MHVDACGCMWMHVDACGCMWMHVDACGCIGCQGTPPCVDEIGRFPVDAERTSPCVPFFWGDTLPSATFWRAVVVLVIHMLTSVSLNQFQLITFPQQ